jgi:pantoate--beta-alanine ligase
VAMSSRNLLLSAEERARARALPAALSAAAALLARGERAADALVEAAREELLAGGVEPEYVALVEPDTLEQLDLLRDEGLLVLAGRIGAVRLIDNAVLAPGSAADPSQPSAREVLA